MIRWMPDTCGCVLVYEHDGPVPVGATFVRVERSCPAHQGAMSAQTTHDAVVEENVRKNAVLAQVENLVGRAVDAAWWFDDTRTLHVKLPSDVSLSRAAVAAALAGRRVVVE